MLDLMFVAAHALAAAGWICLLLAPMRRPALIGAARWVGVTLALAYTILFLIAAPAASVLANNYSLAGVAAFFADPQLRLVGWVHYLAFDLWVGAWEAEEADRIELPHGLLVVALVLTFLVGPVGLTLFIIWRAFHLRQSRAHSLGAKSS